MLYRYGLGIGARLVRRGKVKESLRYLIVPVNYWRTVEYKMVNRYGGFGPQDRILDIGSPKLFSVYLAEKVGAEVYATDIEPYFLHEYDLLRRVQGIQGERLHLQVEDGRQLSFPQEYFTGVYSISVLEHIPEQGDSDCAREIGRVLAKQGRCVITVPFAPTSRDEHIKQDFYWSKSSVEAPDGKVFFQRRYSEQDLFERIIRPSGLKLRTLQYVGEKAPSGRKYEFCEYLPRPTGPVQPLLSKLLHTPPTDSWQSLSKPLCAVIVLEKE
jgi:SAM-dependent methyltransferase